MTRRSEERRRGVLYEMMMVVLSGDDWIIDRDVDVSIMQRGVVREW
jgi:hypothetical protein